MNTHVTPRSFRKASRALATALCGLALFASHANAASETWTRTTTGGNWSDLANWLSGTGYANGVDSIATFSAAGTQTVNLDTNVTLGSIVFSTGVYTISSSNGSVLTLATSTGTPIIASSGTISATLAGTQGFTMNPGGIRTLTLSGANTYTGQTLLTNGNLIIRSDASLGASGAGNGTVVRQNTNAFPQLHIANNITTAEDISLQMQWSAAAGTVVGGGSGGAGYMLYNDSGTNTLNGTLTLDRYGSSTSNMIDVFGIQAAGNLTINGNVSGAATAGQASGTYADPTRFQIKTTVATANTNINGVISNGTLTTGGLSFYTATDNLGIVRLTAANTYSGNTVHQKGSLLINNTTGSGTGTGSVTVLSTAVFGGTGTIAPTGTNSVVFQSGSIVSPGDLNADGTAIAAGAKLTFALADTTGGVNFNSGSTISLNLNAVASTVAESLAFTGLTLGDASKVTFNNNVVNFSTTGGVIASGLYTIASFDAANAYSGNLLIGTGLEAYTASLIYNANSIQLQISAVPEPSTVALIAGASALGFVALRRRLKKA